MDDTVGRFGSRAEAEMARRLLDDAGIPARIRADDAGSMHPELGQVGERHGITLVVAAEHREEARVFLDEVADVPTDWEEPDRSRHVMRFIAAGVVLLVFTVGIAFEVIAVVTRWL